MQNTETVKSKYRLNLQGTRKLIVTQKELHLHLQNCCTQHVTKETPLTLSLFKMPWALTRFCELFEPLFGQWQLVWCQLFCFPLALTVALGSSSLQPAACVEDNTMLSTKASNSALVVGCKWLSICGSSWTQLPVSFALFWQTAIWWIAVSCQGH